MTVGLVWACVGRNGKKERQGADSGQYLVCWGMAVTAATGELDTYPQP